MLGEAYKTQADLEVQLNVAKSNLKLVIANNEMLEDALKRDTSGQSKDVGWRRSSAREGDPRASVERSQTIDYLPTSTDQSPPTSADSPPSSHAQDTRFFKFRFSNPSTSSRPTSRPATPVGGSAASAAHHLTSPSMPSLSSVKMKELEDLTAELEKEKAAKKLIADEKAALEAELESLSQALFEEVCHYLLPTHAKILTQRFLGQQYGCDGAQNACRGGRGTEGTEDRKRGAS